MSTRLLFLQLSVLAMLVSSCCGQQEEFQERLLDFWSSIGECNVTSAFPEPGNSICYQINTTPNPSGFPPFSCQVSNEVAMPITLMNDQVLIQSPANDFDSAYPNMQLCRYTPPKCPTGFQLVRWSTFDIEEKSEGRSCLDHVKMFLPINEVDSYLEERGAELDRAKLLCGKQDIKNLMYLVNETSRQVQVLFRSGNKTPGNGFSIIVMCVTDEFQDGGMLAPAPNLRRSARERRELRWWYSPPPTTLPTTPLPPPCTVVPDTDPPPTPEPVGPIVKVGNRVNVPRPTFITYRRNTLKIMQGAKVLRKFSGIYNFIFWTPNNGTRVFTKTAAVPDGEIFGGGTLTLINGCAYYINFLVPPKFEPNSMESSIISTLLDASAPFFRGQVILRPGPPGTIPTPCPKSSDTDIDPKVLELALAHENACNNFLRTAAQSLLAIIRTNGLMPHPPSYYH